ncbi:MAG: glycosyltransferase family 39 protein [bacterium]
MRVARPAAALSRHWGVGLLLALAGAVYAQTQGAYGMLMWDEAEYASLARSLVRGDGYTIAGAAQGLRPPLLPLAAAAGLWLNGRADDPTVHAVGVALAVLALAIVYTGAARAYDRATGLVAAALLASMPWFWSATARLLSEIPLLALFGAALLAWSGALLRDARWFYVSWGCLGLALLTRYTALLFGPLALLLTLAAGAGDGRAVWRRLCTRHVLLAPLLGLVVFAPWLVHQGLVFGDPLVGFRQASSQLQDYMPGVAMPWWRYVAGLPAMLSWPTAVLALFGVLWAARKRDHFALQCVLVVVFILIWFSCYRYKEARLVSAILPAVAVLAALGLTRGLFGRAPPSALAAIVAAIALFNFGATRPTFEHVHTLGYPSFLAAMDFVRQHSSPDALLVGPNTPQIFWYADRRVTDFPEKAALPALLDRVEWVIVTDFERGQKAYVPELAARIPESAFADGRAVRFADGQFSTLVVRPALLAAALK